MKLQVKKLEQGVSGWQHASFHPHRFGGMEFRFGDAEVGHVHTNGIVDIPSRAQYAMHCWQMVLLRSTAGFPIQARSRFRCAMKKT